MSVSLSIKRRSLHAVALVATLASGGCGGGGGGGDASPAAASPATVVVSRPVEKTDLQIAQDLYGAGARTPPGFYEETAPADQDYVSTVHLKNTDVDPALSSSDPQHELCTNDWSQALDWSESSAQSAPQYADLVATNDDARYFEFNRVRSGDPQFYLRTRVFKCAYLDRTTANLRSAAGGAGQLNQRPLTADGLRILTEYLWQFTAYNNFGHAVLKSSGTTTAATLTHTLIIANLVRSGTSATCDRIDVIAWRHSADASSGALQLDLQTLWSFGAHEGSGTTQLCSG